VVVEGLVGFARWMKRRKVGPADCGHPEPIMPKSSDRGHLRRS